MILDFDLEKKATANCADPSVDEKRCVCAVCVCCVCAVCALGMVCGVCLVESGVRVGGLECIGAWICVRYWVSVCVHIWIRITVIV